MKTQSEYVDQFGGELAVYERILSLTDCALLEREYDQTESDSKREEPSSPRKGWMLGYMIAIGDRLIDIDCFDVASGSDAI
jgi:hypothetical protein